MISGLMTNPYMPVTDPTQYYGRQNVLRNVALAIRNWEPFATTGEPRIGKSSFLYYLAHPGGAREDGAFSDHIGKATDYLFVLIELQLLPVRNTQGFWRYLFDRLVEEAEKMGIGAQSSLQGIHKNAGNDAYQVQMGFERSIKQMEKKVLFLFDDFDILIKNFENSDVIQITGKLRALKNLTCKDELNYVIISTDPLTRLFEMEGIVDVLSPLTNIILADPPLGLLEKDAVDTFLQTLRFSAEDATFIAHLAGRYPDFLKFCCFYLLEAKNQGPIDYSTVRQTLENDRHIQGLMKRLWERIKQDEPPLKEALLQIAQGQKEPTNRPAFRELCQRGLVDDADASPRIFGELFHTFILQPGPRPVIPAASISPPAKLTFLESKLYNYLAEHAEQTCTREELKEAIWGSRPPASPDALEQLVKRLRWKIEPPDQPPSLLNVRGQGYLLRQPPAQ